MSKARRTESEWRALVQELDVSGASVRDFAERRRLNMGTVAWWRSYFRRQHRENATALAPVVEFAQVKRSLEPIVSPSRTGTTGLTIFTSGIRIALQRGFDPTALSALLDVLDARQEDNDDPAWR